MRPLLLLAGLVALALLGCGRGEGPKDARDPSRLGVLANRDQARASPGLGGASRPDAAPGARVSEGGKLVRVTDDSVVLQLEQQGQLELRVDADTRVSLDGRPARLGQLQPGQEVRVLFAPGRVAPLARSVDAASHGTPEASEPQNIAPTRP